jgi:hypothetical protein
MLDALTLWSLAVLVVGGLMYVAMTRATAKSPSRTIAVRRPAGLHVAELARRSNTDAIASASATCLGCAART